MLALEVTVALGAAVLLGSVLALRLRLAAPVVLVAAGLALSTVPALHQVGLPPDTVLLLFLPVLLYWESLTTSEREIRRFLRGIVLNSTLLVVVTAGAVAVVGHALGLAWPTAWLIGAAVAPTDATAVGALGRMLPRSASTVLRAESLINDGTALVVFALALEWAQGGQSLTFGHIVGLALVSVLGGLAAGLLVGVANWQLRRRLRDTTHSNVASVLSPFLAYLLAEEIGASGVLAVVTCGLFVAHQSPVAISARARHQSTGFWVLVTFLLSSGLFVLIGLQLPAAIAGLTSAGLGQAVVVALAVFVTLVLTRFVFIHAAIALIRLLDRRPAQRSLRTTFRGRVVSTVAGFRGAVSLAVELSVPATVDGSGGTARDMVVFVTAGVVAVSLVVQGPALPRVVRWARLPPDSAVDEEEAVAGRTATEEVLAALPEIATATGVGDDVREELRAEYEARLAAGGDPDGDEDGETRAAERRADEYARLKLAVLARKRVTVVRLRDERTIDDTVLRRVQRRLDIEELRLGDVDDD